MNKVRSGVKASGKSILQHPSSICQILSSSFSWCFSNNSFISLPFTSVNLPMLLFLAIPLYLVNSTYHAHFFLDYSRKSSLITLPYHRSDLLVNGLKTSELYLHNCDHSSYIFICIIVYVWVRFTTAGILFNSQDCTPIKSTRSNI